MIFAGCLGALFFLALILLSSNIAGGDDAYRHVRFAHRLATDWRAALADPWRLPYFWPKPLDVWFGYHVLLAPFTLVLPLIVSVKLMGAILWGGSVFALLRLLDVLGARWSRVWVVLAVSGSTIVLYRAALVRPFLFSLLLVLLATRYVIEDRPRSLAAVSFLHALSYSIFFFPALPAGLYFLIRRDRRSARGILWCALGMFAGICANPFFPENVKFSFAQTASPWMAGASEILDIGGESRPLSSGWLWTALPVFAVWLPALAVMTVRFRRQRPTPPQTLVLSISVLFLIAAFRAARSMDYFVPFAVLFAAAVLSPWLETEREKAAYGFGFLFLLAGFLLIPAASAMHAAPSVDRFRGASEFLAREGPDALVVNTHWEQYPLLYFWNWRSRYVTGIDPTFLYLNDPRRFWLWRHMADDSLPLCGQRACQQMEAVSLTDAVAEGLGARYVIVDRKANPKLDAALRGEEKIREAFRDDGVSVFAVMGESSAAEKRWGSPEEPPRR